MHGRAGRGQAARGFVCTVGLTLSSGCVGPVERTIVTGQLTPKQIRFVTVHEPTHGDVGGWRAACLHIRLTRSNTGESILCRFGVETPLRNKDGPISIPLAQRIAADRINEAAHQVLGAATAESPLGMLCQTLKATIRTSFMASIAGARLPDTCDEMTTPVQFGDFTL
jgi:hypothetical protein